MIGVDLSLTGTGIASNTRGSISTTTITTKGLTGRERRNLIVSVVTRLVVSAGYPIEGYPCSICIEGLAFGARDTGQERAGLWYRLVDELENGGCRVIVVPPTSLKKFVTGAGNAEKSMMVREVFRRWGIEAKNDNEADAAGLLMCGLAVVDLYPGELTGAQREVVQAIKTPKIKKAKSRVCSDKHDMESHCSWRTRAPVQRTWISPLAD